MTFNIFKKSNFKTDRAEIKIPESGGLKKILSNILIPKPVIDKSKCIKCGVCLNVCPVKPYALNWQDQDKSGSPAYNYSRNYVLKMQYL